jgi:hypothetical protein
MEKPGSRRKLKVWDMAAFRERDKALESSVPMSARKWSFLFNRWSL